jgi:hypothetical protein
MSGYLQRLAVSARNAAGAIHPVLGSVFSTPKYRGMSEEEEADFPGIHFESQVTPKSAAAQVSEGPKAAQPEEAGQGPLPHATLGRDSPIERDAPTLLPAKPTFPSVRKDDEAQLDAMAEHRQGHDREAAPGKVRKPLMPGEPSDTPGLPDSIAGNKEVRDDSRRMAQSVAQAQEVSIVTPLPRRQERDQEAPKDVYRPLMAELVRAGSPSVLPDAPNLTASSAGKKEERDVARPPARPTREADEIHIHIGRIEVTAVPPAPARPAAKPAPRSESLDDYLKRRDGRTL